MSSFPLLISISVLLSIFLSHSLPLTSADAFGTIPLQELQQCVEGYKHCEKCEQGCNTPDVNNFFFAPPELHWASYMKHRRILNVLVLQHPVLQKMRNGMPDWCTVSNNIWSATDAFQPSKENCLFDPYKCSQTLQPVPGNEKLQEEIKKLGEYFPDSKLWKLQHRNKIEKADRIASDWKNRVGDHASAHLANPAEQDSMFADPVFLNYTTYVRDGRKFDIQVSRSDSYSANIENQFVRRETVDLIPGYVKSLLSLRTTISSQRENTEKILAEIKSMLMPVFRGQAAATNVIYESTHEKHLKGEVKLLDGELQDLYSQVKNERGALRTTKMSATYSKLRMIGMVRRLVQILARRQTNCGEDDKFAFSPAK